MQSQVEMRIAAVLSQDPDLMKMYRDKLDIHSANAKACFSLVKDMTKIEENLRSQNLPEEEYKLSLLREELKLIKKENGEQRDAAKSVGFGILFLMSAFGLKRDLDNKTRSRGKIWDIEDCKLYIKKFQKAYPVLKHWMDKQQTLVKSKGYIRTVWGRIRPLPDAFSQDWKIRGSALRQSVNTACQSGASDLMVLGILNVMQSIDLTRAKLVMTVHDSVVFDIEDSYVEEAAPIIKRCLEHPLFYGQPLDFINIPLVADFQIGKKYGEMVEYEVK